MASLLFEQIRPVCCLGRRGPGLAKDHAPIVADVKPGAILSHKGNIQSHGKHA